MLSHNYHDAVRKNLKSPSDNEEVTFLKSYNESLSENDTQDFLVFFALGAYLAQLDTKNKSRKDQRLFPSFPTKENKRDTNLKLLYKTMSNDAVFMKGYGEFINQESNLNYAFAQVIKHYSELKDEVIVEELRNANSKNDIELIQAVHTMQLQAPPLSAYYESYMHLLNKMPMSQTRALLRPNPIAAMIDKNFERVSNPNIDAKTYQLTGTNNYVFYLKGFTYLSMQETIAQKMEDSNASEDKLQILDIGTGNGMFIDSVSDKYPDRAECFGLTAVDFRDSSTLGQSKSHYILANAEKLATVPELKKTRFDLIVSRATFIHFLDPASALIQAYSKLKPGGMLVVDEFALPGCEKYLSAIITYLKKQGYQVSANYNDTKIHNFLIIKTHPSLHLPLNYKMEDSASKVKYDVNEEVVQIHNAYNPEVDYIKAVEIINSKKLGSAVAKFPDLETLFNRSTTMDNTALFYSILAIVAKTTSYDQYLSLLEEAKIRFSQMDNDFYYRLLQKCEDRTLNEGAIFYLLNDASFRGLDSKENVLLLLTIAAVNDLMRFESQSQENAMLSHLNIDPDAFLKVTPSKFMSTYKLPDFEEPSDEETFNRTPF